MQKKILNIDLISEMLFTNLAGIAYSYVSAVLLDMKDAHRGLT